jgi:hypothetical protein
MRWLRFLQRTAGLSAGAAAGAAVTAAATNPVIGAAAGVATAKSVEELIAEFLPAQQQALDELVERTRGIERLLGTIHSDIQTLLDAPWRAALLHIEDAARHPERAPFELQLARNALYLAWGSANKSAKRALIAQQLSAVYALLGEREDGLTWLYRSYAEACNDLGELVASLIASIPELPRVKSPVPGRSSEDTLDILRTGDWELELVRRVRAEPLVTALGVLAQTRLDLYELRLLCALADVPEPWIEDPSAAFVGYGGYRSFLWMASDTEKYWVRGPGSAGPVELLLRLTDLTLRCQDVPVTSPGKLFVTGASPQLGRWREDQSVPLQYEYESYTGPFRGWADYEKKNRSVPGNTSSPDSQVPARCPWSYTMYLRRDAQPEPVEYRYFYVESPGAERVWEPGPARCLPSFDDNSYGVCLLDSWGQPELAEQRRTDRR